MKRTLLLLASQLIVVASAIAQDHVYKAALGAGALISQTRAYSPTWRNQIFTFSVEGRDYDFAYPATTLFSLDRQPIGTSSSYHAAIAFPLGDGAELVDEYSSSFFLNFQAVFGKDVNLFSAEPYTNGFTGASETKPITNTGILDGVLSAGYVMRGSKVSFAVVLNEIRLSEPNGSWNWNSATNANALAVDFNLSYKPNDNIIYNIRLNNVGAFGNYSVFHYHSGDVGDPLDNTSRYVPTYLGLGVKKIFELRSGNKWGIIADIGKELTPSIPNAADQVGTKHYDAIGPFAAMFTPNQTFGFAVGSQYIMQTGQDENVSFSGGYTNGSYFKGFALSVGFLRPSGFHPFLGYQIPTSGSIGTNQISLGVRAGL